MSSLYRLRLIANTIYSFIFFHEYVFDDSDNDNLRLVVFNQGNLIQSARGGQRAAKELLGSLVT